MRTARGLRILADNNMSVSDEHHIVSRGSILVPRLQCLRHHCVTIFSARAVQRSEP